MLDTLISLLVTSGLSIRLLVTDISIPAAVWIVAPVVISTCQRKEDYVGQQLSVRETSGARPRVDRNMHEAKQKVRLTGGAPGAIEKSNRRTSMASAVTTCVTQKESNAFSENPAGTQ